MSIASETRTGAENPLIIDGLQLIGGDWVPASSGETIEVLNPANREVLARIPAGGAADVDAAVEAAEKAFPTWRDTNATARGGLLFRWAELIEQNSKDLDQVEAMEVGRPARSGPSGMAGQVRFIAGQTDKVQGLSLPTFSPGTLGFTLREPFGVVGAIIPWNAPGPMFVNEVAAAIAAGNTIVIKPAEDAPLTPLALLPLEAQGAGAEQVHEAASSAPPKGASGDGIGRVAFRRLSDAEAARYRIVETLSDDGDLAEVARNLFAALRRLDTAGLSLIHCDTCEPQGLGQAIMDRLQRAAARGGC